MRSALYAFGREPGMWFRRNSGTGQQHRQRYNRPTQTGSIPRHIGEGFHGNWLLAEHLHLLEIDADHWKT